MGAQKWVGWVIGLGHGEWHSLGVMSSFMTWLFPAWRVRLLHRLLWLALGKCWLVLWALLVPDAMFPRPSESQFQPLLLGHWQVQHLSSLQWLRGLLAHCLWGGCWVASHLIHGVWIPGISDGPPFWPLSDASWICFVFYKTDFWFKTLTHFTFK